VVLVASLVAIYWQATKSPLPPMPTREWYYDLNSRQLFPGPVGQTPPIAAPSGSATDGSPAGVRARVFTCGKCSQSERFIGYLETYSSEMKQRRQAMEERVRAPQPAGPDPSLTMEVIMLETDLRQGLASLVKRPEDAAWVPIKSPEGQQIVQAAHRRCGANAVAKPCSPRK